MVTAYVSWYHAQGYNRHADGLTKMIVDTRDFFRRACCPAWAMQCIRDGARGLHEHEHELSSTNATKITLVVLISGPTLPTALRQVLDMLAR